MGVTDLLPPAVLPRRCQPLSSHPNVALDFFGGGSGKGEGDGGTCKIVNMYSYTLLCIRKIRFYIQINVYEFICINSYIKNRTKKRIYINYM